ncbi:hypothetical protein CLPUN_29730 [Clostridium puniceum]|uniref:Uncharacterized protein n=1 Tax=Clostridium puniceum TaxID=29367 RepID=A0A1S8TDZ8_9CLOT|nr:hypothetical protein CLPUN_29730 [Clostridium puniceum]
MKELITGNGILVGRGYEVGLAVSLAYAGTLSIEILKNHP